MNITENKAVLSAKLNNTALGIYKHRDEAMPALCRKGSRPISFTNFGRHCAERFSNSSIDAEFELWKILGRSDTSHDVKPIFCEACDVMRVRFDATVDTVDTRRAGLNYAFDNAAATYARYGGM
jgi:hypothetical protein